MPWRQFWTAWLTHMQFLSSLGWMRFAMTFYTCPTLSYECNLSLFLWILGLCMSVDEYYVPYVVNVALCKWIIYATWPKYVHVWNVVALDFTARPTSLNLNFSLNSRLSGGGLSLPTTAAAGNSQDSKSKFYMLVDGKSKTISVLRYYPLQYNFLVFRVLLLSNRDTWVSILKIRTAKA